MEHGFTWFSLIPALEHGPHHVTGSILIASFMIITMWVARVQMLRAHHSSEGALIPDDKLSYRNFFEILAEGLFKLTQNVIGDHDAPRFYPMLGVLFTFIFFSNLLGLIPGFLPPTDNLNTTLALGTFVFIYYNWVGIKEHGIGYLKHFMGPVLWLSPLMAIIEIASHVFRPLSLALRLRGNIMGDHVVLSVFSDLAPYLIPMIFYGLGIFVAFVQAFVFCLMTMVYISLSTSHDH
ncbi:MAG: ATP synthase F0 subunit A [Bdellovibrionaceae bacterium]|nr:ATP synthase F0 subunit A [Pseudobdellovibrionaceae bacterium]|tara:strand:+ start:9300 stop:10007 length:708 start_codon:yes stop_codon:yes gene_type:complete